MAGRARGGYAQATKEKELLEAVRRRGRLTVTGGALETSLCQSRRPSGCFSALAAKGRLARSAPGTGQALRPLGETQHEPLGGPVYGGEHKLIETVYTQLERDVQRLGGFEALIALADMSGRELEF